MNAGSGATDIAYSFCYLEWRMLQTVRAHKFQTFHQHAEILQNALMNAENMLELDDFDRRLLRVLQEDNRLTGDALAEATGLSPTACQRRVKKLRAAGVIKGDVSIVSPKAVGRPLTLVVTLTLERERVDIVDSFKRLVRETPEIMAGYYLTGEADFLMIVTARDMEDFENFSRRVFYGSPHIKGFKTMVVMDRVKASYSVPV